MEYCIDEEIADLVAEMAQQDTSKTFALLCGLLIGLAESCAERQGENPSARMELVGGSRMVTIEAKINAHRA